MSNHANNIGDEYNDPFYDSMHIPDPPQPHRVLASHNMQQCNIQETPWTLRECFEETNFPTDARFVDNHNSPGARLVELIMLHGDDTALMQLDQLFIRYQMKSTPMDRIAKDLDISVAAAKHLWKSYKERQRLKIQRLDNFDILGQMLGEIDVTTTELFDILTKEQTDGQGRAPSYQARINAAVAISDNNLKKAKLLELNGFYKTAKMGNTNDNEIDAVEKAKVVLNMVNDTFDTSTYTIDRNQEVDPEERKELLDQFDQYRKDLKDYKESQ